MWHLTFRFTHTQAAAMRATTPTITTATTTTTKTIAATALLGAIKTAKPNRPGSGPFCALGSFALLFMAFRTC